MTNSCVKCKSKYDSEPANRKKKKICAFDMHTGCSPLSREIDLRDMCAKLVNIVCCIISM